MEAETYLSEGHGLRQDFGNAGWRPLGDLARIWQPNRLRGVVVGREHGIPYLAATQVFDIRPTARRFLAMDKIGRPLDLFVKPGTILVSRSGAVGRSILSSVAHEKKIISDDLLRVEPRSSDDWGWLYAFLRSPQSRAMMTGAHYGHVIKHLERSHLDALPVPTIPPYLAKEYNEKAMAIVTARNNATRLREEAEDTFAQAVGVPATDEPEHAFTVPVSRARKGRRRLEAAYHTPHVRAIIRNFTRWQMLGDITDRIWWPNRFKRVFAATGATYMSANDVFTINPHGLKLIALDGKSDFDDFMVDAGWILMARSGQTYGLNGSAMLTSDYHKSVFLSEDLIRIRPTNAARVGYLLTALTHPVLGRPLLIREAYGMSIPHLDPEDVAAFPVVRLDPATENAIADLAERSASEQARAEVLERELADAAGKIIAEFLMRPSLEVVSDEDAADAEIARQRLVEIEEHPERVLRGEALEAKLKKWES